MIDCDRVPDSELVTWHHMSMRGMAFRKVSDLIIWLRNHEGGRFYWTANGDLWFEQVEDFTSCVLSWK